MTEEPRNVILRGDAYPELDDLAAGAPFWRGNPRWDLNIFARRTRRAYERPDPAYGSPAHMIVGICRELHRATLNRNTSDGTVAHLATMLMDALSPGDLKGRERCRRYLAAFGQREEAMTGYDRRKNILSGRSLPTVTELEDGLPFYADSIRRDIVAFAESELRRHDELAADDATWNGPDYWNALKALSDAASDDTKSSASLQDAVHRVMAGMANWSLSRARCLVYMRALGTLGEGEQSEPMPDDYLIHRIADIHSGRAFPGADELLCGMPFYKDSIHWDMRAFVGNIMREERELARDDEGRVMSLCRHLQSAVGDASLPDRELEDIVAYLMDALPEDKREERLRCRFYIAVFGDYVSQVHIACDAVSAAIAAAKKERPTDADIRLIGSALGWVAASAAHDNFALLSRHAKPEMMNSSFETARVHGRTLVDFLKSGPVVTRQDRKDTWRRMHGSLKDQGNGTKLSAPELDEVLSEASPEPREDDPERIALRRLLERGGSLIPEQEAADRLEVESEVVRDLAGTANMIGIPQGDTFVYPDCQIKGNGLVPGLQSALSSFPILDPWKRLAWLLSENPALDGQTPLDALQQPEWRDAVIKASQEYKDATEPRYGDERKRHLIRMIGGAMEEDLMADWLRMPPEKLRKHAEAGDLIAVELDGRWQFPAFQAKDDMTLLTVREMLAALPLRDQWRRIEWLLSHPLGLGGLSPLETLRIGKSREVIDCARYGADF
jgi:hypothetical protein